MTIFILLTKFVAIMAIVATVAMVEGFTIATLIFGGYCGYLPLKTGKFQAHVNILSLPFCDSPAAGHRAHKFLSGGAPTPSNAS